MPYERHRELHGELPSFSGTGNGVASPLLSELTRGGLRGRGGGGFPLATKLAAVLRGARPWSWSTGARGSR